MHTFAFMFHYVMSPVLHQNTQTYIYLSVFASYSVYLCIITLCMVIIPISSDNRGVRISECDHFRPPATHKLGDNWTFSKFAKVMVSGNQHCSPTRVYVLVSIIICLRTVE